MRMRSQIAATACSVVFNVVLPVSGFTQSDSSTAVEGKPQASALPIDDAARAVEQELSPVSVMRVYARGDAAGEPPAALPPSLTVPEVYRETIELMLERSSTFRRQCLRLRNAAHVRIRVRPASPGESGRLRARTTITRAPDGTLDATVSIQPLTDVPELIAHELEHVIEQVDGVDLAARSLLPGTGVRDSGSGMFETIRAVRVGAQVARETRTAR